MTIGDLWEPHEQEITYGDSARTFYRVIPTNLAGPMGAGLALEARRRYSRCARDYQVMLRAQYGAGNVGEPLYVWPCDARGCPGCQIIWFATKRHWRQDSDPRLIDLGLHELAIWAEDMNSEGFRTDIYLPLLGCGLGRLSRAQVEPLMASHLGPNYFHLVLLPSEATPEDYARG